MTVGLRVYRLAMERIQRVLLRLISGVAFFAIAAPGLSSDVLKTSDAICTQSILNQRWDDGAYEKSLKSMTDDVLCLQFEIQAGLAQLNATSFSSKRLGMVCRILELRATDCPLIQQSSSLSKSVVPRLVVQSKDEADAEDSWGVAKDADFQKGLDAYNRGDFRVALLEWVPLANQGGAEAQYRLGSTLFSRTV